MQLSEARKYHNKKVIAVIQIFSEWNIIFIYHVPFHEKKVLNIFVMRLFNNLP